MIQPSQQETKNTSRILSRPATEVQAPALKSNQANTWIAKLKKWVSILEKLEREAILLDGLVSHSIVGEEENLRIVQMHRSLKKLIKDDIRKMKVSIFDMQQNVHLMVHNVINGQRKMKQSKQDIRSLSDEYEKVKLSILKELTTYYPARIF